MLGHDELPLRLDRTKFEIVNNFAEADELDRLRAQTRVLEARQRTVQPPMTPSTDDIQHITSAIVRDFQPRQVILFGSRVYGEPRPDSDVDMLVVLPFDGSPIALMSAMLASAYKAMPRPFAVEFHPRRPLNGAPPDPVMSEALRRGVVLYEAAA